MPDLTKRFGGHSPEDMTFISMDIPVSGLTYSGHTLRDKIRSNGSVTLHDYYIDKTGDLVEKGYWAELDRRLKEKAHFQPGRVEVPREGAIIHRRDE